MEDKSYYPVHISDQMVGGYFAAGVGDSINYSLGPGQWDQLQAYPWLEELRNEPEVATVIEQYLQKKARIADELREMLKQPEWSH